MVIFITKYFKNDKNNSSFLSFFVYFSKKMFLSKAFSISEINLYQILRLNYYKKLKEWRTDDVDGDCISFNLYRNTESSIVL